MPDPNPNDGWCPFATRVDTTKFWTGNQGRRGVVLHIAQGSYDAAVSWLSNAQTNPNSSAHFVIAKDGRISQLVSINDSAWANGLGWQDNKWTNGSGQEVKPTWQDIIAGVNPNWYTISIEHEGVYTEAWTAQMYDANTRLLAWIANQVGSLETSPLFPFVAHRNLIGHYEIDPLDRANCPGPTVNYFKISADTNAAILFAQINQQSSTRHIYGTTALVTLPGYTIVKQLTEVDIPVVGYLDFHGTHWAISQYSFQNKIPNFFDSASTIPPIQDLTASLSINPGFRDSVTPGADELKVLGPLWLRVLIVSQFQNKATGQNTELDWLIDRCKGLGINLLVLVNTETLNETPPAHGNGWGDANSGYIQRASDLAQKVSAYYHGKIGAIEVFNEPDTQGIVPEDYAALLKASYAKIKAVSSLPVISAGICCGENFDYLRRVAQVARGSYDGVGWHLYGERVDGFPYASFGFGEMRDSISSARAFGGKPLWITETGAKLDWNWGQGAIPADSVAAYLTRAYALMRSLGKNVVAQALWFTWKIAGDTWGLVDDAGAHLPSWFAFVRASGQTIPPPAPPAITFASFNPTVLETGQSLSFSLTVQNNSSVPLATQGPPPGFTYAEGETFETRGFPAVANAFRVGIDFDGRTGMDHPYRWGLGSVLAPGATATVTGSIRLTSLQSRNYWLGLVKEQVAWLQNQQWTQVVTVKPKSQPPPSSSPVISSVVVDPKTLDSGQLLNLTIGVRNDSSVTLQTQGPAPGFSYNEGDTFSTRGFGAQSGAIRVGVDFTGDSGIDHPYRWGLGAPLAPGQTTVVTGSIKLNVPQTRNYWVGLVRELNAWLQDNQGLQVITVHPGPQPPGGTGQLVVSSVTFKPTTLDQGQLVQVSVTLVNNTGVPVPTQGPAPGFVYNEGDNYLTKKNPPIAGAFRIGVDFDARTGIDHPYRWGFGGSLAPGNSVTCGGFIRLNRRQNTNFWAGVVNEGTGLVQDNLGKTMITVLRA